jgi:glycosyltransferase involved in cell wall biosynthesis
LRIAFYAPMKPPDHPSPSGDRLMARQIMALLEGMGHDVFVASELVTRTTEPDPERLHALIGENSDELTEFDTRRRGADVWITYHLYHKAPDLLGPIIADVWDIPYLVIEASYTPSKDKGPWAEWQATVRDALEQAAAILPMTRRDREGLEAAGFSDKIADFPPFLLDMPDAPHEPETRDHAITRLLAVAMMRPGHKLESYRRLAAALMHLPPKRFGLRVIGDGPCRAEVKALFAGSPVSVDFLGRCDAEEIGEEMRAADIFVWPGIGEAYGMVYLEAQARGLPVVAARQAGVPDVVADGVGGILVDGDEAATDASVILRLADDASLRRRMGVAGHRFVSESKSAAGAILESVIRKAKANHKPSGFR